MPETQQPVDRMTGRELLDALDAELDQLPTTYREALVLCYLEGLTRDEAATRLGVPLATLKSRLERGRMRLGEALTNRGCMLGAGLLALAATSPGEAASQRLYQAVLSATRGPVPEPVDRLARGAVASKLGKSKFVGLLALIAVVIPGIGFATSHTEIASQPADRPTPAKAGPTADQPAKAPPAAQSRQGEHTIEGIVFGTDGKPFAGAKLHCLADREGHIEVVDLGVSGGDGHFKSVADLGSQRRLHIVVAR